MKMKDPVAHIHMCGVMLTFYQHGLKIAYQYCQLIWTLNHQGEL